MISIMTMMSQQLRPLLLPLALPLVLLLPEAAQARPSKAFIGRARRALVAARAAGLSRQERQQLGRALLSAAKQGPRGDRRDLQGLLDEPRLTITKSGSSVTLTGPRHTATLAGGKLSLRSTTLKFSAREDWGFRGGKYTKLRSGSFSIDQPGISAKDTKSGQSVKLTYRVFGQVLEDRHDARRLIVFDPTVEPVDKAHTYRYKPGPAAMKSLLQRVGRELAREFPGAQKLVVQRWRDTQGYGARKDGQSAKAKDKEMVYDLKLFR